MSYRIDSSSGNPQRIVLRESPLSRRIVGALLLLIGAAALVLGVPAFGLLQGQLLAGAGVVFACAALIVLTQFHNPPTLTFDNGAKALLVAPRRASTGAANASLPYAEIAGFEVHRHVSISSGRTKSTQYTCSMTRKDGARWALLTSSNKADAEGLCKELTARVELAGEQPAAAAEPPSFVEVARTSDGMVIRWKRRSSTAGMALIIGLIAGIGIAGWGYWVVLVVVAIAIAIMIFGWVGSLRTWQRVELGGGMFRYREEGSFFPWTAFEKPLEGIATVLFQFSPNEKSAMLLVIDKAQRDALAALGTAREPDPMQMASMLFSLRRIGLGEMGVDDLLRLERFLEEKIEEARNQEPGRRESE